MYTVYVITNSFSLEGFAYDLSLESFSIILLQYENTETN